MKAKLNIQRVEDCSEWLQSQAESYTGSQSIMWYSDQIGLLCRSLAFINEQMAVAKEILNKRKIEAYNSLIASSVANETYFAPSLAKDYIASKVSKEQYDYDICERTSRTIVHTLEALRSVLSALKEEMKVEGFNQQRA